jgi:mycothiol synthase
MVHPDYRGLGIGAALLAWGEARGYVIVPKAPEGAQVVLAAGCNQNDVYRKELMAKFGMELVRHFFRMEIEFDDPPLPPVIPEGLNIRPYDETTEIEALAQTYLDSFQDHYGFANQSLEDTVTYVRYLVEKDPDYDPELWFVAVEGDQIAGLSVCAGKTTEDPLMGFVNVLGVRRAWRERGLGLALLRHSFVELHRRGCQRVGLGVDASSLTGATRLYEKAGMTVRQRYDRYEKILREGEIITKQ